MKKNPVEVYSPGINSSLESRPLNLILSCEHGGNELYPPLSASPSDLVFLNDHWGYDPGAVDLGRELVDYLGGVGCFAHFSRLICDPNRALDQDGFIVSHTDGHELSFNKDISEKEVGRRVGSYYESYHQALDRVIVENKREKTLLFSLHTFTPVWRGEKREVELGVLFKDYDSLAEKLGEQLRVGGLFSVALNEPYSGKAGLIYSAERHGEAHRIPYLELEVRNDLAQDPSCRKDLVPFLGDALMALAPHI